MEIMLFILILAALGIVLIYFVPKILGGFDSKDVSLSDEIAEADDSISTTDAFKKKISEIGIPRAQRDRAALELSEIVDREVEKHKDLIARAVSSKYEEELEEKQKEINSLQETNENLTEIKKQTEMVVNSLADGVVVVNKKGETLMMNPAAEKLLGVKPGELIGKKIQGDESTVVNRLSKDEETGESEIQVSAGSEDARRVLRSSRAVVQSEDGQPLGMVSVLSDITKQKKLDELKDQFVANVSHELRTPMACIQKSVTVLLKEEVGEVNKEQRWFLDLAGRNIERLTRLVNDLLDMAKLESGQMNLTISVVNTSELLTHILETFRLITQSKEVQLVLDAPVDKPITVEADQDKLIQVLTNLVGNAVKFTPAGGTITLKVQLIDPGVQGTSAYVEFNILDTGPGMSEEELTKLFKRFSQASTAEKVEARGTGLGLSISKEIVSLHHGRIWVESEIGKGSAFSFIIPKVQPEDSAAKKSFHDQ